jgi:hypothetical protein
MWSSVNVTSDDYERTHTAEVRGSSPLSPSATLLQPCICAQGRTREMILDRSRRHSLGRRRIKNVINANTSASNESDVRFAQVCVGSFERVRTRRRRTSRNCNSRNRNFSHSNDRRVYKRCHQRWIGVRNQLASWLVHHRMGNCPRDGGENQRDSGARSNDQRQCKSFASNLQEPSHSVHDKSYEFLDGVSPS